MDTRNWSRGAMSKEDRKAIYGSQENRIRSFDDWPNWAKIAPLDLAKAGLFFIGKQDYVQCFSCGVEIGQWEKNDDPITQHRAYSPHCEFLLSMGQGPTDIPTVERTGGQGVYGVGAVVHTQGSQPHYTQKSTGSKESETPTSTKRREGEKLGKGSARELLEPLSIGVQPSTSEQGAYSYSGQARHHLSPGPTPVGKTRTAFTPPKQRVQYSGGHFEIKQVKPRRQSSLEHLKRQQSIGEAYTQILMEEPHTELTEYCHRDDLLALLPDAKSPFYAHINNRMATYSSWTMQNTVQAKTLAEAGLYYIGEGDKVRCFMCAGTICNWARGDVPWYEHSRWFGACPYLLKCIRHPVIKAIVDTAKRITEGGFEGMPHHHHGSGRTQCDFTTEEQNQDLSAADWSSDTVKVLKNMGYTEDRIKTVVAKYGKHVLSDAGDFIKRSSEYGPQSGTYSP